MGVKVGQDRCHPLFECPAQSETSGIGQEGNEAITSLTRSLPRAGLAWKMWRSFW